MSVWNEIIIGIAVVAGGFFVLKNIYMWNTYRRSIQTEIYSNFVEYQMRKRDLVKLSESYYFKSRFGKHRIVYQIAQPKKNQTPQAYIILILASGLYILNIKNQNGKIVAKKRGDFKYFSKVSQKEEKLVLLKNPLDEIKFFEKKLRNKFPGIDCPITNIVIFPEHCQLLWDGEIDDKIPILKRKQLFGVIKQYVEKSPVVLTEGQIDSIFHTLVDDAIEMEKAG